MEKHIISYSGGLASFFEAKLAIEKYGKDNVELVFCDTKSEDEDLYRFLNDTEKYFDKKIIRLIDGRDIWEIAFEDNFLFNSLVAHCTIKLKMNIFKDFIKQFEPKTITVHIGFDYTEMHRLDKAKYHYDKLGIKLESLISQTTLVKWNMIEELNKLGIELPRLYKLGFSHNNCGGFCFKAGIGHFKQLYEKLPNRYDYHMNQEKKLAKKIKNTLGRDVSILKRVRNGEKVNLTLETLKKEFIKNGAQLSFEESCDIGGCNCFVFED